MQKKSRKKRLCTRGESNPWQGLSLVDGRLKRIVRTNSWILRWNGARTPYVTTTPLVQTAYAVLNFYLDHENLMPSINHNCLCSNTNNKVSSLVDWFLHYIKIQLLFWSSSWVARQQLRAQDRAVIFAIPCRIETADSSPRSTVYRYQEVSLSLRSTIPGEAGSSNLNTRRKNGFTHWPVEECSSRPPINWHQWWP